MGRLFAALALALALANGCSGDVASGTVDAGFPTMDGLAEDAVAHGDVGPGVCPEAACLIEDLCVPNGVVAPHSPCLICLVMIDPGAWSPRAADVCDDGSACTTADHCVDGACVGDPLPCDDGNGCTADTCDPTSGICTSEPADGPCDDGAPCTAGDQCQDGACVPGPADTCDDENPCTDDTCTSGVGCVHAPTEALTCDDGDACTGGGVCQDGSCVSSFALACDDEDVCTADGCDALVGCVFTSIADLCDDGNPCTNPICDAVIGCIYAFNADPCDDENACTEEDGCSGGVCSGSAVELNDENPCTDDLCDPLAGVTHEANTLPCDDGDACSTGDACESGACVTGAGILLCDDENACTGDTCDPAIGCVMTNLDVACDDDSVCTLSDWCQAGVCDGDPLDCDDGNGCTLDGCDPLDGCSHQLQLSHGCRPDIIVTYPPRAATIQGQASDEDVVVTGQVSSGAGPIVDFTINGAAVPLAADGSFTLAMEPLTGGNTLVLEATDSFGTERRRVQAYHWSVGYNAPEPPDAGRADPGMGIFLAQEVIDDGDHSLPADDLATIFELGFASFDVGALLPNPVATNVDGGTANYDVYLSNITHAAPTVALQSIADGLAMHLQILDLSGDLHAKRVSGWLLPKDIYGTLTIDAIDIEAEISLSVGDDHQLVVELVSSEVEITGVYVEIDSWLAFLLEPIINGVVTDLIGDLEDEFAAQVETELAPMLGDALSALAISADLDVPSLDPAGGIIPLALVTDFSATDFAEDGGAFVLRAGVYTVPVIEHEALGAIERAGCGEGNQVLVIPRQAPLEITLADDTLNLLLYGAWEGGLLHFDVPPELLGDVDLTTYGISDLEVTVYGMLAPVISDCYEGAELKLHMGDIEVLATLNLLGAPVDVVMYVSFTSGFEVTVKDSAIAFGLTEVEDLDTEVTVTQDAFLAVEPIIESLVEENLVPALLDGLGDAALGGIPLPEIDLSGAIDGIPEGTGIAIDPQEVTRDAGNTIISGDLK